MLIVSRKTGEGVIIDDTTWLHVLKVVGNRVLLGVSAPPGVTIDRPESSCFQAKLIREERGIHG